MARSKAEKSNYGYFKVYYKGKQFYGKTLAEANAKRDAFMQKEQTGIDVLTHEKSIFRVYAMHWILLPGKHIDTCLPGSFCLYQTGIIEDRKNLKCHKSLWYNTVVE